MSDDPEGAQVLEECYELWRSLPRRARDAIRLVALPMDDPKVNAVTVNAAQTHASVVVQKSLQEGFGLTVTEADVEGEAGRGVRRGRHRGPGPSRGRPPPRGPQ